MKACYLRSTPAQVELAGAAWCRALAADALDLDALRALVLRESSPTSARKAEFASAAPAYDVVLMDATPATLELVLDVRQLLGEASAARLVLFVGRSLPAETSELSLWQAALASADVLIAPQHAICRDIRTKTALVARELLPPLPLDGERLRPAAKRKSALVVARDGYSELDLLRELGLVAYLWTHLRYRVVIGESSGDATRLGELISEGSLVYLPEPLEDGGALAARAARAGALLIATRKYDPAKALFPFTTFGADDLRHRRLLFLWLHSAPDFAAFFRENARVRAGVLRDENRRFQFFCAIKYSLPELVYAPNPHAPGALYDRIQHRSGPTELSCARDECSVVCLLRNGEDYVPSFLEHYRRLGVRHFVFVDNGSDDRTLELLAGHDDVSVYETSLPHKHYEAEIRRFVIEQHCQHRWCLNVDIDELFDYPLSERVGLRALLGYLRQRGASAMAGYLLDMYAAENTFGARAALDLKRDYPCYDISGIKKLAYHAEQFAAYCDHNVLLAEHVKTYLGGIRETVFGSKRGADYLLTKHPLIFLDGELAPVTHPHYSNNAVIADVSSVLYHYKFTPSFKERVAESRSSQRYVKFAQHQYERYHREIAEHGSLCIRTPATQRLHDVNALVEQGFLGVSAAYLEFARELTANASDAENANALRSRNSALATTFVT